MPDPSRYPAITHPQLHDEVSLVDAVMQLKEAVEILLGVRGTEAADRLTSMGDLDAVSKRLPVTLSPGFVEESVGASAWTSLIPFSLPPGTMLPVDIDEAVKFVAKRIQPRAMLYGGSSAIQTPIPMELSYLAGESVISMRAQNTSSGTTTVTFGLLYTSSVL